jgi:hypothetical protein
MHWIADFPRATLLDTFLPLNQTPNPTNPNNSTFNIPTARSTGSELDPNFLSAWLREVESAADQGGRPVRGEDRLASPLDESRAVTPPNEANDEDKWRESVPALLRSELTPHSDALETRRELRRRCGSRPRRDPG